MEFLITYWAERNDEATDIEIIINAENEQDALFKFLEMDLLYKKIENIGPYELR